MPTLFAEEKRPQEKWFSALVASVCCDLCANTHVFSLARHFYIISARTGRTQMSSARHTHADVEDLQLVRRAHTNVKL